MYKNSGRKQRFRTSLVSSHLVLGERPAQAPWFSCLLPRINHVHWGFSPLPLTTRLTISHKSVELEEFARTALTGFSWAFFSSLLLNLGILHYPSLGLGFFPNALPIATSPTPTPLFFPILLSALGMPTLPLTYYSNITSSVGSYLIPSDS